MKFKRMFKITDGETTKTWKFDLRDYLASLPNGEYTIEVCKTINSRSAEQNKLYWKWIAIISEDLGYYPEELHEAFIDQFAPVYTTRDLNGKPKQKRTRTSKMNVEQMTKYMDRISHFCAEHSIRLPL
jgi:hypothetical protein